jgi:hypothetical protein
MQSTVDESTRNAVVATVVAALVRRDYSSALVAAPLSRVSAKELQGAVAEYGRTLVPAPDDYARYVDYVAVRGSSPAAWSVVAPLFTAEEGLSDLSLELTLVSSGSGSYEVEIDGIRVR